MASTSSSHQQNAFSGIEPPNKRRKVEQSSRVFDVFINHRGPDVKLTLATQLYNSLKERHINAFLDSEEKELGDSFPSTIETAITSASVHIAIFSKRYAESPWCLAELLLMLQSKAKIIPLFYQVEPSDLRYIEKGVYREAFLKYEEKGRYLDKIQEWKEALQLVSYTTGHEFKNPDFGDCKDIVSAVEKEVQRTKRLHVAKYPVGLHKLVKDFERQCLDKLVQDFESKCGIKQAAKEKGNIVGLFGMGGVGKTTLSKELFNQKRSKYTRASFLFDVREAFARAEIRNLQSQLLKDLFCEDRRFESAEEGTSCLRDRLERSSSLSFLIVLDDIDHVEQLDVLLVKDMSKKSDNNLIIITTRNVGVLVSAGIDIAYHLRGLDREDGRELFCWHAFDQPLPHSGFEDLVQDFVNMCGGLPLSIIVLGRHVFGREQWYWQDELEKVKEALPGGIKQRLKISIDTLDNVEKQIFMDIACFFIGKSITKAMLIWKGSGWRARRALETLKEKCLVEEVKEVHLNMLEYKWESSIEGFSLRMHDHFRDLGREMADELSHPRRMWRPQDLNSLELKGFQNILTQTKSRCFHSIVDKSIGCGITYFLGEPKDGSNASLLWLQLEYLSCPPLDLNSDINSSIFSWIPLENLQCLRISNGCFQKLWQSDVQAPSHLEELQIRDTFLEEFPDLLGKLNNMKKIVLNAKDIQTDIWYLLESLRMNLSSLRIVGSDLEGQLADNDTAEGTALKSLVIYGFKRLWEGEVALNNEGWSRTVIRDLENLEINGYGLVTKILINGNCCQRLQSLKLCGMKNLIEADLARIKTLNYLGISGCLELVELRLADLSRLEKITIENCNHLKSVSGISNLAKLVELEISGCEMLEFECLCLSGMKCLERITVDRYVKMNYFELDRCENLKTIMFGCKNIVNLSIRYCTELERLSDLMGPSCLKRIVIDGCGNLKYLRLNGLENLESLSGNLELTQLDIIKCPALKELPSNFGEIKIESCEKLQNITLPTTLIGLSVEGCRNLHSVVTITDLTELEWMLIKQCPALEELPSFARVGNLGEIKIESCEKLERIELPTTLSRLSVKGCKDLQGIAGITDLTKLEQVYIAECPKLDLACLSRLSCLDEIGIESCEKLESIELPTTLSRLSVKGCKDLQGIAGITDLTKLEQVYIAECPKLDLACRSRLSCLDEIGIESCEKLQSIELPTTLSRLFVEGCRNLHSLVTITDLTELKWMLIKQCPALEELPSFARVGNFGEIKIESCEKLQNITLPTTLIGLSVEGCRNLHSVVTITDLTELEWMLIKQCPALEELPSFARVGNLGEIKIESCEKLESIELPTTLSRLSVKGCKDLQGIAGITDLTKLEQVYIAECPKLDLACLSRLSCLDEIKIESCEKLQSIELPTTLSRLSVKGCKDLQGIAGITDLTKLEQVYIAECPKVDLACLSRLSCLDEIGIESCEKLESIELPTTLSRLSVKGCKDLQGIAGITDLTKLEQLYIAECPKLDLACLSRLSCTKQIVIESCENLQNISAIEELHVPENATLTYCSYAVVRNFIDKWKSMPKCTCVIGRPVDGAESSLNEHLFSEANIGVDRVIQIGAHELYPSGSEWVAVIVCLVVLDSSTLADDFNGVISRFKVRQGESIVTFVRCGPRDYDYWDKIYKFSPTFHGRMLKKGFRVDLEEGEEWKSRVVLRTMVDRLYDQK